MIDFKIKKLVCVRCITFNHSAYIVDAMNGFIMQKTNFPYVCVIVDDSSTDGEQEIIRNYLDAFFDVTDSTIARKNETEDYFFYFARHKSNKNCFFAVYFLKYNHYRRNKSKEPYISEWTEDAKYVAMCEGDDYWIHPEKLQKQVDYLEQHPNHSLCFHAFYRVFNDGRKSVFHRYDEDKDECPMEDMIMRGGNYMATASMVYVKKMRDDWPEWAKKAPVGDAPLMLVLAERGKVGYINIVMNCYRVETPGSWSVRIAKSRRERMKLHARIVEYKKGFDEWTGYKYHEIVKKELRKSNMHYYLKIIPLVPSLINFLKYIKLAIKKNR